MKRIADMDNQELENWIENDDTEEEIGVFGIPIGSVIVIDEDGNHNLPELENTLAKRQARMKDTYRHLLQERLRLEEENFALERHLFHLRHNCDLN